MVEVKFNPLAYTTVPAEAVRTFVVGLAITFRKPLPVKTLFS
jgi:hypothetical protein